VRSGLVVSYGVAGLRFVIQSNRSPLYLEAQIANFIEFTKVLLVCVVNANPSEANVAVSGQDILDALSEDQLRKHIQSLTMKLVRRVVSWCWVRCPMLTNRGC
jgi:hypothetical protein